MKIIETVKYLDEIGLTTEQQRKVFDLFYEEFEMIANYLDNKGFVPSNSWQNYEQGPIQILAVRKQFGKAKIF